MWTKLFLRCTRCVVPMTIVGCAWLTSTAQAQIYSNCEDWKASMIDSALAEAIAMVDEPKSEARFLEWFGPDQDGDDWAFVTMVGQRAKDGFTNIGSAARSALGMYPYIAISCGCRFNQTHAAEADVPHYSFSVCDSFFNSIDESETRGGILIHEVSHLVGTLDTQRNDKRLEATPYMYSRAIVTDPQGVIDQQWGNLPNLNPGFTWPMAEAENYRLFFENPDGQ